MVAPIVGPVVRPVVDYRYPNGKLRRRVERTTYRQAKPYNLNLPTRLLDQISEIDSVESWANLIIWSDSSTDAQAYNDAYRRLTAGLGESAGMGINIAQANQSMGMITNRLIQIGNFARHLRRLEFARAADDLNLSRESIRNLTLSKGAKGFANNFLEFHFGWSPLISDIYSAVDILQKPIPTTRITGTGSGKLRQVVHVPVNPNDGSGRDKNYSVKVKLGAEISVSNPNLWLANRLGLVNPAAVLWDAIPFSFVVGWFVNVDQFLAQFTEFAGLNVQNSYNSVFRRSSIIVRWNNNSYGVNGVTQKGRVINFSRGYGLGSGPLLRVKKPWQVSATRGATAASLLIQKLR